MKKFFILIHLICGIILVSEAQQKPLSLEDAFLRARTTLAPENLAQLQFFENSNEYVYLKKQNGQDIWMRGNYKLAGQEWPFLALTTLNEYMQEAGAEAFKTMPAIRFGADGWVMNNNGNKIRYSPITKKVTVLLSKELSAMENAEESAAGFTAYLDKYNLFVSNPDKQIYQVTTDGSKDIVYASSVHRDEFGISKGIFWSTKGTRLAFYRMDQSMVTDYPIINWTERPARAETIKYPMAGDKSHHVRVGVYNTATESMIWLKTGMPADQYLTNIAWSPDDKYVFIAVVNREQNQMKLNQYDASTGDLVKTLFEEKDNKYTEPLVPMLFLKNNPNQFIWQSNRDGWNQLYLYDINGKLVRQLTKGNWEVLEIKGFDSKGENLYFMSTVLSAVNKNLCSVNLKTGKMTVLTTQPGVHMAQVSADGSTLLDVFSTIDNPRTIQVAVLKKPTKNPAKNLLQAANPLKDYNSGSLSLFTIKNQHGDSLFCRQFNPVDFSPAKKYPVIVYWYGGPHAQMILNSWNGGAGDYWFRYMAQQGYVVFTVDTRGSDNRGKAFEQSIFRRLGEAQMEDLDAGVNYLKGLSYVDKDRMGLFGWSFGGFLTTDYLLHRPGVFKAAVAGGPVMDWSLYEIMYGERYMDTPQENPEGYAATNLVKQAGQLKDKLLLIHGQQDPVVVQQHSVNFVKACVDKGVQVDYMIYPGHEHNVIGKDRVHLYQKVTDYLTGHLR
jgi:dipeptidyl-peptidase-4